LSRIPGHRESKQRPPVLEKNFQAKVVKKLKTLKNTWFYKASDRVKNGIPDIIACVDGAFVALELKRAESAKATPLQLHTLEEIGAANGFTWVVHPQNWDLVWETLVKMAGGLK
jgi:hypothetical protein